MALPEVEPVCRDAVAVTAARAIVVHGQLDATERALAFDHEPDRVLCLSAQRLAHAVTASLHVSAPLSG